MALKMSKYRGQLLEEIQYLKYFEKRFKKELLDLINHFQINRLRATDRHFYPIFLRGFVMLEL